MTREAAAHVNAARATARTPPFMNPPLLIRRSAYKSEAAHILRQYGCVRYAVFRGPKIRPGAESRAGRLLIAFEVGPVLIDIRRPLVRRVFEGEDGVDGAGGHARAAVDALVRLDV